MSHAVQVRMRLRTNTTGSVTRNPTGITHALILDGEWIKCSGAKSPNLVQELPCFERAGSRRVSLRRSQCKSISEPAGAPAGRARF